MIDIATLRLRYPAMSAVPDDAATYWLGEAARQVSASWGDDQEPATLALAAHSIVASGALAAAGPGALPAGVTSFRSGAFSATVSEAAVSAQVAGGFASTPYGQEYARFLRVHEGGPMLVGAVPCDDGGEWW